MNDNQPTGAEFVGPAPVGTPNPGSRVHRDLNSIPDMWRLYKLPSVPEAPVLATEAL